MAYSIAKVDNQTIRLTYNSDYTAGTSLAVKIRTITPSTYTLAEWKYTYLEGVLTTTEGYKDDSGGEEIYYFNKATTTLYYDIPFDTDKVYQIDIMINFNEAGASFVPTRKHFFISTYTLDTILLEKVKAIICCNPSPNSCSNDYCAKVYDFNVLNLLSNSYFGNPIDVAFNYGNVSAMSPVGVNYSILYANHIYECVTGATGADFLNCLVTMLGVSLSTGSTVVAGENYICISDYTISGGNASVFTALTDDVQDLLNYIADAMERVNDYTNANCVTTCSC